VLPPGGIDNGIHAVSGLHVCVCVCVCVFVCDGVLGTTRVRSDQTKKVCQPSGNCVEGWRDVDNPSMSTGNACRHARCSPYT
jgi:hypothetical protein